MWMKRHCLILEQFGKSSRGWSYLKTKSDQAGIGPALSEWMRQSLPLPMFLIIHWFPISLFFLYFRLFFKGNHQVFNRVGMQKYVLHDCQMEDSGPKGPK